MIKHIFFIFLFFSTFFAEAQYNSQFNRRQNMRSRQPMATQKPRAPKINVEKAVGLIFYNIEKVSKKIGIKETSDTYLKVFSILNSYNKELKQIKRINTFLFSEGKSKMEAAQKEAIENRDPTPLRLANKEVTKTFKPIIGIIEEKDEKLNLELEGILSAKQLKKWKKYKASVKKK
jgi:hypothetical protein